jgi:hypothetical protein
MYDKIYYPYPSTDKKHKYLIITDTGKKIRFGAAGYNDYTTYYKEFGKQTADEHKLRYIKRHQERENWGKSGINSAGWWSRFLIWEESNIKDAYRKIKDKLLRWGYITKEQYNNNIYI